MRLFSHDTKVEALKRVPLFAALSKKELGLLARTSEDMAVPSGKVLCKQGDVGCEFFAIVDGEVDVRRNGRRINTGGPGDFFGEIALIQDTPRTATVTASTPLRFFVLTSSSFHRLLADNPPVQVKVLQALAKRVVTLSKDAAL